MACQTLCPVSNEHVNKIIDMRRYEVMNEKQLRPELQLAFKNVEAKYNPWGVSWSERASWSKDLDVKIMKEAGEEEVEYLYWVGCAGSFDSRARKVSVAVAKILKAAGSILRSSAARKNAAATLSAVPAMNIYTN
jgi:Fe-S oxidoreductase